MNKKKIIVIAVSVICIISVIVASVILLPKLWSSTPSKTDTSTKDTATTDQIETVNPSVLSDSSTPDESMPARTTEETTPVIVAPDSLIELLSNNENSTEELSELGCGQLITVDSSGSSAQISFYSLIDNEWKLDDDLSCSGYVGANGVTANMHEGGYASPRGLYPIGEAFYIYNKPETGLSTFEITNDTYWVDDPNSKYYNKRVDGTSDKDWNSAEHMIDYSAAYEYGFVIDYNHEAVYNAGSAIFFHVSYGSTAGCVGTNKDMVLAYLSKSIHIDSLNP